MEGWIKLHRKILDNPIICKDNDTLAVWIYLLLNATHQDIPALFKGKKITLKKGQLITGRNSIGSQLNISPSKVQRILKMFEDDKQIEQQTSSQNRLISILNWGKYQEIEQQMNNDWTANEQRVNTNKNKRTKEIKRNIKEKYGEYKNVLLSVDEYEKLKKEYNNYEELIKYLDEYIEMKGYKAKSHYLCIKKWVVDAVEKTNGTQSTNSTSYKGKMVQVGENSFQLE